MKIDKIALIHIKNKKVLGIVSKGKNVFYLPGGKREEGETDQETLIREIKEELSVDIIHETIKYYGTFSAQAHGKQEGTVVKLTCYIASFEGKLTPDNEIDYIEWANSSDIDNVPPVDKLILKDLKEKDLID